jgi:hypothetical protein
MNLEKINLNALMEVSVEDLLGYLPNNICTGEGDSLGTVFGPRISKNIEGKYAVEYSQLMNDTVYKKRKVLFKINYGANLKLVIAEALIRISEIKKTLLAEREKYGN